MFFEMFLRIFSDCCVFFALLGSCPSLLPYSFPLPAAALICAAATGLSALLYDKGRELPGRACAVLPFLSLLLAGSGKEMLILVVPTLYSAFVIFRGEMYQEYFSYRSLFIRSLITLCSIWAIISICIYIEDPKGLAEKVIFPEVILQYTLLLFLCGIVLQRQLRLGAHSRAQGEAGQLIGMLGSAGVVTAGFFLTEPFLQESVVDLIRKAFVVILTPFAVLLELIVYFISKLDEMQQSEEYKEALENSEYVPVGKYTDYQDLMNELLKDAPEQGHSPWIMVFAALGTVLLLVLMVFAFVKLRGHSVTPVFVTESTSSEKKKKVSRLSNRGKVRQAYRDFLRYERQRGFVLKKHYTTADILRKVAVPENETAAAELREVYIRARYDEKREVTRAHAEAARNALRNIRKQ